MTKSTTGAYGDFPDYYYERGNQFGAYLLGRTPAQSWDARMEATLEANTGPIIYPSGAPPAAAPKADSNPHDELMVYVRAMLSPTAAARILNALAHEQGIRDVPTDADPYRALDRFALANLDDGQLQILLERMRRLASTAPATGRISARRR